MTLPDLLTTEVLRVFVVFARIGAVLMLAPGFGETYVPGRFRLLLSLALSVVLTPVLAGQMPPLPAAGDPRLLLVVGGEVVRGLLIGAAVRTTTVSVSLAGTLVATQSGLAGAVFFDPHEATQASIGSSFMIIAALAVLFATDAHHGILVALAQSYVGLPMGSPLPLGDSTELLARVLGEAMRSGMCIAAPVVVTSLLLNIALGAIGRLVPTLQVLFVATPVQLMLSLGILMVSLAAGLRAFLLLFGGALRTFVG